MSIRDDYIKATEMLNRAEVPEDNRVLLINDVHKVKIEITELFLEYSMNKITLRKFGDQLTEILVRWKQDNYDFCEICGASLMTANCNNARCDD